MFSKESLDHSSFSWQAALSCCVASQLAYQSGAAVKNIAINNWGLDDCEFIDTNDTQLFIASTTSAIIVAFRGTESVADWFGNLNVLSVERGMGSVHQGFSNAYDDVHSRLESVLTSLDAGGRRVVLTGHSLGGALATIAAAEFESQLPNMMVYTFGQPRTAKSDFQTSFDTKFHDRFFRFVNEDDIVTRVPPGYQHVQKLFHLRNDGSMAHLSAEVSETSNEPLELSEDEFETLQEKVKSIKVLARSQKTSERAAESATNLATEGLFPGFSDHKLENYIAKIRPFAHESPRIDGIIEVAQAHTSALEAVETNVRGTVWGSQEGASPVLLRLRDKQWTPPAGIVVQSKLGRIVTVQATHEQIEALKADPKVQSIEASRDGGIKECAVSLPFVKANTVQAPPIDERGSNCLVGIVDTGVDILHECFLDDIGNSRILAVWNQRDNSGPSPKTVDPATFTQSIGTLHTASDIAALIQGNPNNVPNSLRDTQEHGTHVASIAAGRAVGTFGGGMAPESGIVVVIPNMTTDPADPPSLGYSNSHVDALAFLAAFAEKESKPIAINVSLGMNAGAHDGLSTLEAAFDAVTGMGRDPGIAIIKSAGNEKGHGGHAQATGFVGVTNISWESEDVFRQKDYIEIWFDKMDSYEFELTDPAGNKSSVETESNPVVKESMGGNFVTFNLTRFHRDNGDHQLQIAVVPQSAAIQKGVWNLRITGTAVMSAKGRIDAWVERDRSRAIRFLTGDNDEMTLSIPGTSQSVITVSACHSKLPLESTDSSSRGLTRDQRPKPDLCAPGHEITAARANSMDTQAVQSMTGTSMAAPHVTGAVALAFSLRVQKNLIQLNAQQVRATLNRSAVGTGMHHDSFGFGHLDVLAFIDLNKS